MPQTDPQTPTVPQTPVAFADMTRLDKILAEFDRLHAQTAATVERIEAKYEEIQSMAMQNRDDTSALIAVFDEIREQFAALVERLDTQPQAARNRVETEVPNLEKFVPRADFDAALNRANTLQHDLMTEKASQREKHIEDLLRAGLQSSQIVPATQDYYRAMCQMEGGIEAFERFLQKAPPLLNPVSKLDSSLSLDTRLADPALEFARNAALRDEFGTLERYRAYRLATEAGLVVSVAKEGA
ncbi:MAG: phage protease [Candidatus Competibacter sp.]|jgi:phage I-like protein